MRKTKLIGAGAMFAALAICVPMVIAQWGPSNGFWHVNGNFNLNCPPNSCSVMGATVNLPGLSAKSQLLSDTVGSANTTKVNSGLSFPLAANEVGTLNCAIFFTNGNGGGLALAVNGPGTPTQVTVSAEIESAASTGNFFQSQGTSWAAALGSATSTVTTLQWATVQAGIENGPTAGTLAVQFSNVNTTGSTVVKRGSWCSFP